MEATSSMSTIYPNCIAPGLYKVHGCIFGYRRVAPENTLGRTNKKEMANNQKELGVPNGKIDASEGQLKSTEIHIDFENDQQSNRNQ